VEERRWKFILCRRAWGGGVPDPSILQSLEMKYGGILDWALPLLQDRDSVSYLTAYGDSGKPLGSDGEAMHKNYVSLPLPSVIFPSL
jgi:hypothetical protein